MKMCPECYSEKSRITPLLNPKDCLQNHTQYICGTCGRCICIQFDAKRKLQRWNFPFRSPDIARLYLRTADVTMQKPCGIYELKNGHDRLTYKIFAGMDELNLYLKKNKDKACKKKSPVFSVSEFRTFPNTEIRKLTAEEVERYLAEHISETI